MEPIEQIIEYLLDKGDFTGVVTKWLIMTGQVKVYDKTQYVYTEILRGLPQPINPKKRVI